MSLLHAAAARYFYDNPTKKNNTTATYLAEKWHIKSPWPRTMHYASSLIVIYSCPVIRPACKKKKKKSPFVYSGVSPSLWAEYIPLEHHSACSLQHAGVSALMDISFFCFPRETLLFYQSCSWSVAICIHSRCISCMWAADNYYFLTIVKFVTEHCMCWSGIQDAYFRVVRNGDVDHNKAMENVSCVVYSQNSQILDSTLYVLIPLALSSHVVAFSGRNDS